MELPLDAVVLQLVSQVAAAADRPEAGRALARAVGGTAAIFFLRDPATSIFVPAPGFPRTLPDGLVWRELLRELDAAADGRARGRAHLFHGGPAKAEVVLRQLTPDLAIAVEEPAPDTFDRLGELASAAPLLEAALSAERRLELGEARAAEAAQSAERSRALSRALSETQRQLRDSIAALRERDSRKDQFLAMLAHELRNPLAPLLIGLQLIARRGHVAPESGHLLEVATRQAQHLARLVDDLLDVARITHGRLELRKEPLDARPLVRRAVEALRPAAESRSHRYVVELDVAREVPVVADAVRLEQVITNVVSNAIKYTDPGGTITVRAFVDGGAFAIRITDTGVGISADLLPHIFEPFVQADSSLHRSQGGMGLGLAVASGLVRMHGGELFAHSDGPGRGTTFELRLPIAHGALGPREAEREVRAHPAPRPRRVLVVDDNVDAAEALAEALRSLGHLVRVSSDGEAALLEAEAFTPEVVFLDIGLPGLSGYEIARRLRTRASTGAARIYALTGYGREEDRARALGAGFNDHFVKPLDLRRIEQAIEARA